MPGDRDPRKEDRQLFLDALLAAQDRVILTAPARSQLTDKADAYQLSLEPSWACAAAWTADRLYESRVRSVLDMEPKQRDSVKMTVTKVLTAWLLTANRDTPHTPLNLDFFDDPSATLYLLTPADGTVAAQAIVLMDQIINRQRTKVAQWQDFQRIGLFLDEITNTPIPRLPQYLAESRGLGCSICFAAQAGSHLDAIYGPLQGKAIRDVTPAGSFGKVFGFLSTGFNVAGVIAPIVFGLVMDHGNPRAVFLLSAAACLVAVATVITNGKRSW